MERYAMAFVEFKDVGKTYHMGEVDINALHDTSFEIEKRSSASFKGTANP